MPAVVVPDVDGADAEDADADPPEALAPPPEPAESLALVVELPPAVELPPVPELPEVLEGAGAFTSLPDCAYCACSGPPPQAIAAHTIPIAIRCFTRSSVSRRGILFLRSFQMRRVAKTLCLGPSQSHSFSAPCRSCLHTIVLCPALPCHRLNRHCVWFIPSVRMTARTPAPFW
jgi:hypothetical protein